MLFLQKLGIAKDQFKLNKIFFFMNKLSFLAFFFLRDEK